MHRVKMLNEAAARGDAGEVKKLVADGADVNLKIYDETPLHAAIAGAYAESQGRPAYSPNPIDYPQVVKILLESKADPTQKNGRGQPIIHEAAFYGCLQILKILLERKEADIEQREDEYGMSPLIVAASTSSKLRERAEILQTLLDAKADVNAKDKHERTAFCQAVRNDFPAKSVKALIESKADVNREEENGKSPIHYAAQDDNLALVQLLLENKANVNRQDNRGYTPFYDIVSNSHPLWNSAAIYTLVKYKADVSQPDKKGEAPIKIAVRKGHKKAIELAGAPYIKGASAGAFSAFFPIEIGAYIGSFFRSLKEGSMLARVNKAASTQAKLGV